MKTTLISTSIIVAPDLNLPFELMYDTSNYAIWAILGQQRGKVFHAIYYSSRTLIDVQLNYATIENEMLVVVFAFDKFQSYLIGTKIIAYIDQSTIKYLIEKK